MTRRSNHSTAQGALNAVAYTAHQGMPMPLLLVCEDNGWGISVPTPTGWVEASLAGRPGLRYERVDSTDPVGVHDVAEELADDVRGVRSAGRAAPADRAPRRPRRDGRRGGVPHASGDPGRSRARPAAGRRPCPRGGRRLAGRGRRPLSGRARRRCGGWPASCIARPRLRTAEEVVAPLAPRRPAAVADRAVAAAAADRRVAVFGRWPEDDGPLTLAESINRALADLLAADERVLVFGEDVAAKGGVYGVTRGLQRKAGRRRVFDTLLDEQSILGLALGAGVSGLVPIPEIQYLAYLHNAEDQLRGEAASLAFFSAGQYTNPLVVRVAGYGYQQGFGGHFHNDNGLAVLRDVPGLVIASPAHPADAPAMLRTCVAAAVADGTVSVFLEPIARYHTRDLHVPGDEGWTAPYAPPDGVGPRAHPDRHPGDRSRWRRPAHRHVGEWSLPGAAIGRAVGGGRHRLPDPRRALAGAAAARRDRPPRPSPSDACSSWTRPAAAADRARRSSRPSPSAASRAPSTASPALDSFVPLGDAAGLVLVSEDDIESAARRLVH